MKKLVGIVMGMLLFFQVSGSCFAVKYMDVANGGGLLPIDPNEEEVMYIAEYQPKLLQKGTALDMKKDNESEYKRIPLSYPANISIRVPVDSSVHAGYLGSNNPGYQVKVDNKNYRAEFDLMPRESFVVFSGGKMDDASRREAMTFFKKELNPSVKFISKGYVKTTMDYERATTSKADYLVASLGNEGFMSIKVVPKSGKVNKEWMNDIIRGLELFDIDQQIDFYYDGHATYTNPVSAMSGQNYMEWEQYYLKDYYKKYGRSYDPSIYVEASQQKATQYPTQQYSNYDTQQELREIYEAPAQWGNAMADILEEAYDSLGMGQLYKQDLDQFRWQADHFWDYYFY